MVIGGLLIAACGSDTDQTNYNAANRDAFLAACTDSSLDDRLVRNVCECVYEQIESNMEFEELEALEGSLQLDALRSLPDDVAEYVAECFVAEAEL